MPEYEIREELETMSIQVQAVMQLLSWRRDRDAEKDRSLTPHFIVLVAWGPDVVKVFVLRTLRLQVKVWRHITPRRDSRNANSANASGTQSVTATTHLGAWDAATPTHQGRLHPKAAVSVLQLWRQPNCKLPRFQ
jgi:hypothetical protein